MQQISLEPGHGFPGGHRQLQSPGDLAAGRREESQLRRKVSSAQAPSEGWHFLTGQERYQEALADTVGFHYKYDPITKQYAHASGIMVLTPEGKISRYFYGIEYKPRDLRLGLVEASARQDRNAGRSGAAVLLPLRSDDRKIRPGHHQRHARARLGHRAGCWAAFVFIMSGGNGATQSPGGPPSLCSFHSGLKQPLSIATDVDHLYIYLSW